MKSLQATLLTAVLLCAGPALAGDEIMVMMSGDNKRLKDRLDQGLNPNTVTSIGSLLSLAAQANRIEMVQTLLDRGANVNQTNGPEDGSTALTKAVWYGHDELVKLLLSKGADPNSGANGYGSAPLTAAFFNQERLELMKVLLDHGARVDLELDARRASGLAYNQVAVTPLMIAAKQGRLEAAKLLIERGARVDAATRPAEYDGVGGFTPLMFATEGGSSEMVALLIDKGARVDGRNSSGSTALHYAARFGKAEAARALLDRGADPNAVNTMTGYNYTPLMEAISVVGDKRDVVKALLEEGASLEIKNAGGDTALMMAQKMNFPEIAKAIKDFRSGGKAMAKEDLQKLIKETVASVQPAAAKAAKTSAIVSDVDKPKRRLAERPHDYAVVVGIERYSDLPEAPFAERDAEAVKNHLLSLGFPSRNVVLLSGEKAGYKGIEKFVETWLPRNADETSSVFFYFSGHGAPDVKSGQAYLVPWDGDAAFLENTGYPVKRLYQKLGALKAKRVIVALDACFSGAGGRSVLAKGARPLVLKTETEEALGKLIVFAAASGEQMTTTLDEQGHGTFTYYFLKGLSAQASGAVTAGSLYDFLKPKVEDAARRQNRDQAPVLRAPSRDEEIVRF